MSLKILLAVPVFLVLTNAAGAAGQRYADVPPGTFVEPPAADTKIKAPTGGTKLPAVQKAREAANRSPQADKHRGEIEIQSFSLGATGAPGDGKCVAGCSNNLTPGDGQQRGQTQTPHVGGMLVGLGDGSVRNGVSPVGGNETISIGAGSTETKPGSGNDSVWMDLGTPAGRAPGSAPKGGSLGSLQGMGSINQLAAPQGTGDAAGGQVRNRMFSIVDRTPTAKDGANTGAVGGNKTQNIGIGRTETTTGGGPHVKAFSGADGAGGRAPGNMTLKGQAIKQN